jgi:hypothetical protein
MSFRALVTILGGLALMAVGYLFIVLIVVRVT